MLCKFQGVGPISGGYPDQCQVMVTQVVVEFKIGIISSLSFWLVVFRLAYFVSKFSFRR